MWKSEATGNYYPTKYVVEIPGVKARIDVAVYEGIPQQEAVSEAGFNRYEAHSTCQGTFMGEDVTGFCCVEYVGDHREAGAATAEKDAVPTTGRLDESVNGTFKAVMRSPMMGDQDIVFDYATDGEKLTGTVTLMGRTTPVEEGHATAEGFIHTFAMKIPVGKTKVTVTAHVDGDELVGVLSTRMGEMPIVGVRQ